MLGKIFSRQHSGTFFLFFSKHYETICIKCQSLLSRKNKKNINMMSAEIAQGVVKV